MKCCFSFGPSESPLVSPADHRGQVLCLTCLTCSVSWCDDFSLYWIHLYWQHSEISQCLESLFPSSLIHELRESIYVACVLHFLLQAFFFKKTRSSHYISFDTGWHKGTQACLMSLCSCLLFVQAVGDQVISSFCVSLTCSNITSNSVSSVFQKGF